MRDVAKSWIMFAGILAACGGNGGEATEQRGSAVTSADAANFHYTAHDLPVVPPGYDYYRPEWIGLGGDAFSVGDADCGATSCRWDALKVDAAGNFTVLAQNFQVTGVDAGGDVGGCTAEVGDDGQHILHAAFLHADGQVELLSPVPDAQSTCISLLSDGGHAAYVSATTISNTGVSTQTSYVWLDGSMYPVDLPADYAPADVNDRGELVGQSGSHLHLSGFRYAAATGTTSLLEPAACDAETNALATNQQGGVLGYSFTENGEARIVAWDDANQVAGVFVDATVDGPDWLGTPRWNGNGLVVVASPVDGHTYLFSEPGVRLDLADLLADPADSLNVFVLDVNDHGDILAAVGGHSRVFIRDE